MCQQIFPHYPACGHTAHYDAQLINCNEMMHLNRNISIQAIVSAKGKFVGERCTKYQTSKWNAMGLCPRCRGEKVVWLRDGVVQFVKEKVEKGNQPELKKGRPDGRANKRNGRRKGEQREDKLEIKAEGKERRSKRARLGLK